MQEKKDRQLLIFINLSVQIMFVFYSIFFNIFIYSINNDLFFVLILNGFSFLIDILFQLFLTKILSKKNAMFIYRLSFLLIFVSILLAFFVTKNTLWLAWLIMGFFRIAKMCFYVPQEISVMDKGKNVSMKKFVGLSSIVSSLSTILGPFLSGFIIGTWSYFAIFSVILAVAFVAFVLSIFLSNFYVEPQKDLSLGQVFKLSYQEPKTKMVLWAFAVGKFSQASVIPFLLPVLLFLKTGTEMSVGFYSSLIAVVATLTFAIYVYYIKNNEKILWVTTVLNFMASLILVIYPTFVTFLAYYIVRECCYKIFHNSMTTSIFTANQNTVFAQNKREYHMVFSTYNHCSSLLAILLTVLMYSIFPTELCLSIIIIVLSAMQFLSVYLLNRSDYLANKLVNSANNNH